jgi:hypothetical protein
MKRALSFKPPRLPVPFRRNPERRTWRPWVPAFAGANGVAGAFVLFSVAFASAQVPTCDPVDDEGWRMMATVETAGVADGAPVKVGSDWFVERVTTLLPMCNYFDAIGNYSLRSYSLDPFEKKERVAICRGAVAVAPYAGKCPPQ